MLNQVLILVVMEIFRKAKKELLSVEELKVLILVVMEIFRKDVYTAFFISLLSFLYKLASVNHL